MQTIHDRIRDSYETKTTSPESVRINRTKELADQYGIESSELGSVDIASQAEQYLAEKMGTTTESSQAVKKVQEELADRFRNNKSTRLEAMGYPVGAGGMVEGVPEEFPVMRQTTDVLKKAAFAARDTVRESLDPHAEVVATKQLISSKESEHSYEIEQAVYGMFGVDQEMLNDETLTTVHEAADGAYVDYVTRVPADGVVLERTVRLNAENGGFIESSVGIAPHVYNDQK